jgi:hypothetical protein
MIRYSRFFEIVGLLNISYESRCETVHEHRTMMYNFPLMSIKAKPELYKQKIIRAAMKAYWPLRMAGFDYLLAPIILWASVD